MCMYEAIWPYNYNHRGAWALETHSPRSGSDLHMKCLTMNQSSPQSGGTRCREKMASAWQDHCMLAILLL